jgi:hypothetical protein
MDELKHQKPYGGQLALTRPRVPSSRWTRLGFTPSSYSAARTQFETANIS